MRYVVCPEKITGPAPDEVAEALGLPSDMPCGLRCEVVTEAPVMQFRCGRGHAFYATPAEVQHEH